MYDSDSKLSSNMAREWVHDQLEGLGGVVFDFRKYPGVIWVNIEGGVFSAAWVDNQLK